MVHGMVYAIRFCSLNKVYVFSAAGDEAAVCANQNLLVDYAVQISIVTDFVSSSSVSL